MWEREREGGQLSDADAGLGVCNANATSILKMEEMLGVRIDFVTFCYFIY